MIQILQETAAYVEMARLFNLIPSCILVFLGAWASHHETSFSSVTS